MSQEDIYEVERLENAALERCEEWLQKIPCATCKDCYSERDFFPCNDCSILDLSRPISHWKHYKEMEQ